MTIRNFLSKYFFKVNYFYWNNIYSNGYCMMLTSSLKRQTCNVSMIKFQDIFAFQLTTCHHDWLVNRWITSKEYSAENKMLSKFKVYINLFISTKKSIRDLDLLTKERLGVTAAYKGSNIEIWILDTQIPNNFFMIKSLLNQKNNIHSSTPH